MNGSVVLAVPVSCRSARRKGLVVRVGMAVTATVNVGTACLIIIIIMYIYHALINAMSAHMIHINLNMLFYTHGEHSPTKTVYIKYYKNI